MVQSCSGDPGGGTVSSTVRAQASESRNFHGIVHQPPTEKCEVKACANEPKPPRLYAQTKAPGPNRKDDIIAQSQFRTSAARAVVKADSHKASFYFLIQSAR
jgi:hypothetical protein